jgi:hypothetical protein
MPGELRGDAMDLQGLLSSIGGSDALNAAASQAGMEPDQAHSALQGVLEHLSTGGAAEGVVDAVAAKTGLDPSQIEAFLPQVMPLLQGHADAAGGDQSGMSGLLGAAAGMLGGGGGGDAAASGGGGLMGLVSGLFGKKD